MEETFKIVPAGTNPVWLYGFLFFIVALFVVLGWVVQRSVTGATASTFIVSETGLKIKGDLYGRTIPMKELRLQEAKAVDLAASEELRPKWKRAGTSFPGYQSGWFTLRSGEKALLYLTDRSRVAYLPTQKGYSVLLSVEDPHQLIASLRRNARE